MAACSELREPLSCLVKLGSISGVYVIWYANSQGRCGMGLPRVMVAVKLACTGGVNRSICGCCMMLSPYLCQVSLVLFSFSLLLDESDIAI